MDRDRFNALLADMSQITDADIKSLNQLRKQYPYFQNQYVMMAKALKDREHPKADAFVKKAALFVADQGLLKGIINGTHDFVTAAVAEDQVVEAPETTEVGTEEKVVVAELEAKRKEEEALAQKAAEEENKRKAEEAAAQKAAEEKAIAQKEEEEARKKAELEAAKVEAKKAAEEEALKRAKEEAIAQKEAEEARKKAEIEAATKREEEEVKKAAEAEAKKKAVKEATQAQKTAGEESEKKASSTTEDDETMLSELDRDLKEIKEKKRLLAKMLEQSEAKEKKPARATQKKTAKRSKKNQSELIEKFIRNEPQMDKQKLVSDENSPTQVDLASKNIKDSDQFYTETLAKLMVKQKKYKKAIEIYEKLGLKFPEKRAYFASQIEKVNNKSNV